MQTVYRKSHRSPTQPAPLLSDLTDVAKMAAGRLNVQLQESTLAATLQSAIETTCPLMSQKGIEFVPRIAQDLPRATIDPARITQILNNLLGNAVKFTPRGGCVRLEVQNMRENIQFCISDTGPGIPPEALPHIFEQNWQLDPRTGGMGLGLFIAKTLVEAHGGRIWVQTTVNHGSEFYFTLPTLGSNQASKPTPV